MLFRSGTGFFFQDSGFHEDLPPFQLTQFYASTEHQSSTPPEIRACLADGQILVAQAGRLKIVVSAISIRSPATLTSRIKTSPSLAPQRDFRHSAESAGG